jgi:hypothetical protein
MGGWINLEGHRQVSSPLSKAMLAPLPPDCERVQFNAALTDKDYRQLAKLLAAAPKTSLRVYQDIHETIANLEFLRHFPRLRRFWVELQHLSSFEGLGHLPADLEFLHLGATRKKGLSLKVLKAFTSLRELVLGGHQTDIEESLAGLRKLRNLAIGDFALPDLSVFGSLKGLTELNIQRGRIGLAGLADLGRGLASLAISYVRDLADVTPIAELSTLKALDLECLPRVERLPNLKECRLLRKVRLENMRRLNDLSNVAAAPALEELRVVMTPELKPEAFKCFVGHPELKRISIGLGAVGKNKAVEKMLGLTSDDSGWFGE